MKFKFSYKIIMPFLSLHCSSAGRANHGAGGVHRTGVPTIRHTVAVRVTGADKFIIFGNIKFRPLLKAENLRILLPIIFPVGKGEPAGIGIDAPKTL